MNKRAKKIKETSLHKGYIELGKYNFEVSSLSPHKDVIVITDREVIKTSDSVTVLLYFPSQDSFIFCQQFRAGVFLSSSNDNCFTLECVAGTIDNADSPEQTALREIKEETGIELKDLQLIAKVYKSPGIMTEKNHLFYGEVNASPASGLHGVGGEEIVTKIITREKIFALMDNMQLVDAATLILLNWFRAKYA